MEKKLSAYERMKFCMFCGAELVWIDTRIDDVKACPKSKEDTVDLQRIVTYNS